MGGGEGWSGEPGLAGLSQGTGRPDLGVKAGWGYAERWPEGWSTGRDPKS